MSTHFGYLLNQSYITSSSVVIPLDHSPHAYSPTPGTGVLNIAEGKNAMGGFDPKEINPLDSDLSSAEKSLTLGTENQVQCNSSSIFSDRRSVTLSVFDPNNDGNSELGVFLLRLIIFNALKRCHLRQRKTHHILKFDQR